MAFPFEGSSLLDRGPAVPGFQSRVRVRKWFPQAIPTGAGWQKITFDAVEFDGLGEWNVGTNTFVPVADGYYLLSAYLCIACLNTGFTINLCIWNAAFGHAEAAFRVIDSNNEDKSLACTLVDFMAGGGNGYTVRVNNNTGANRFNKQAGFDWGGFSVHRLS